jgi:phenylpropionate dioxygenase-like ring-hydroxylating dioxygenase large terminal subunit
MSVDLKRHTTLPIPDGWFAVAWSKDLVPGDVQRLKYFDEELVLFRTRAGEARVLDAYCAHLGAHLGEGGKVIDDAIRCPFHQWHYDGTSGRCVRIPYAEKIPAKAKVRAWEVVERNGMIFVWRHAAGAPPNFVVPHFPEFDDPDWTPPRYFDLKVAVHMQEMAENNCDPVHFKYVHGLLDVPDSEISFSHDGLFMHMTDEADRPTALGTFRTRLDRDNFGIGIATVRLIGIPSAGLLMLAATTPIDRGHTHSRWIFTVTRNLADTAGEEFVDGLSLGVQEDVRIWENKIYRPNPVLCDGDLFLGKFRQWTKQFYSEATP